MRTSFTVNPSVDDNAWLTRRTQPPQCIPSIRNVNSDIALLSLSLNDDINRQWIQDLHPEVEKAEV